MGEASSFSHAFFECWQLQPPILWRGEVCLQKIPFKMCFNGDILQSSVLTNNSFQTMFQLFSQILARPLLGLVLFMQALEIFGCKQQSTPQKWISPWPSDVNVSKTQRSTFWWHVNIGEGDKNMFICHMNTDHPHLHHPFCELVNCCLTEFLLKQHKHVLWNLSFNVWQQASRCTLASTSTKNVMSVLMGPTAWVGWSWQQWIEKHVISWCMQSWASMNQCSFLWLWILADNKNWAKNSSSGAALV